MDHSLPSKLTMPNLFQLPLPLRLIIVITCVRSGDGLGDLTTATPGIHWNLFRKWDSFTSCHLPFLNTKSKLCKEWLPRLCNMVPSFVIIFCSNMDDWPLILSDIILKLFPLHVQTSQLLNLLPSSLAYTLYRNIAK